MGAYAPGAASAQLRSHGRVSGEAAVAAAVETADGGSYDGRNSRPAGRRALMRSLAEHRCVAAIVLDRLAREPLLLPQLVNTDTIDYGDDPFLTQSNPLICMANSLP